MFQPYHKRAGGRGKGDTMRGTRGDRTRENQRFLKALRRTANVTLAAEEAGQTRKTFQKRRARNADFASQWDAALAYAQAQLAASRGVVAPAGEAAITGGGEYSVRASRGRALQVRRAPKGLLTTEGERRFLAHLAATANVRLSAEATGIGWSAIYARRARAPDFARAMATALAEGYERLELALLDNALRSMRPDGAVLEGWEQQLDETDPLTRMTPREALLLLGYRRPEIVEGRPHAGFRVPRADRGEALARLTRELDRVERRLKRDGG